jgi:hypothetical protein
MISPGCYLKKSVRMFLSWKQTFVMNFPLAPHASTTTRKVAVALNLVEATSRLDYSCTLCLGDTKSSTKTESHFTFF